MKGEKINHTTLNQRKFLWIIQVIYLHVHHKHIKNISRNCLKFQLAVNQTQTHINFHLQRIITRCYSLVAFLHWHSPNQFITLASNPYSTELFNTLCHLSDYVCQFSKCDFCIDVNGEETCTCPEGQILDARDKTSCIGKWFIIVIMWWHMHADISWSHFYAWQQSITEILEIIVWEEIRSQIKSHI